MAFRYGGDRFIPPRAGNRWQTKFGLMKDGADLPPLIVFDVSEDAQMPTSKGSFSGAEGLPFVRQFLEQYYQIYDSDKREQLDCAYHDNAMFSMTSAYPPTQSSTSTTKLANCITDSYNLVHVNDNNRKQKLLLQGKTSIVAHLSKLPKTQHFPLSFAVDLTLFTPQMITMSVTGLFQELGPEENQPLRSFNRVFVIVPHGVGFCINNEQMLVTNPTEEQRKMVLSTSTPPTPAHTPVHAEENMKNQMVANLASMSGMNCIWSRKCLDDVKWDFQQAVHIFTELNKLGKVPPDAFIK